MTSENLEVVIQLMKDDVIKENTKMRGPIPHRLQLAATNDFLSTGNHTRVMFMSIIFSAQQ